MNLIEGLVNEITRCKEVLKQYERLGPVGSFGYTMIKMDIEKAEKAISEGDTVMMVVAAKSLKEVK